MPSLQDQILVEEAYDSDEWVEDPTHDRCGGNDHWKGTHATLEDCKTTCAGFTYMTYAAHGDKNCACQDTCEGSNSGCCDLFARHSADQSEPWPRNSAKCDVTSQAFTDCLGSFDSSCAHGVGVDSPFKIPDQAITTNAPPPEGYDWAVPSLARLGNTGQAWLAATDTPADYVQYDLGELRIIAAMRAQGADHDACGISNCPARVMKKFKLVYSRDGKSWIPLTPKISEAATEFAGPMRDGTHDAYSKAGNEPEEYTFPSTSYPGIGGFEARYVRVYIVQAAYWGQSSIQMEFYGPRCRADGLVPVGIASLAIPDSAMTQNENYAGIRMLNVQNASAARLNGLNYFLSNWKGYDHSPAGYGFRNQLWVQVDIGKAVSVGAVATDGDGWHLTEYKLGGSLDGTTFAMVTGILSVQSRILTKHYVQPFSARYVRLYPWDGVDDNAVGLRMELYAVVSEFQWRNSDDSPRLGDHTSAGAIGSDPFCNLTMLDLAPSFSSWTEGMHGDGSIYKSEASQMELSGTEYSVIAYQRSTVKFMGIMHKHLVCFTSGNEQKCCVNKQSSLLGRGVWGQQEDEIKMS